MAVFDRLLSLFSKTKPNKLTPEELKAAAQYMDEFSVDENLFFAILSGDDEKIYPLIALGADVNAICNCNKLNLYHGLTPLMVAISGAKQRNELISDLLVSYGADVNAVSQNQEKTTPLIEAIKSRDAAVLQTVLDAGADINLPNGSGETPIMCALNCIFDKQNITGINLMRAVEHLLKSEVDLIAKNNQGMTMWDIMLANANESFIEHVRPFYEKQVANKEQLILDKAIRDDLIQSRPNELGF